MKNVLALVSLLAFASIASAQEVGITEQDVTQSNPESILLLVNESQPNQVIVYDVKGEWLSAIREITLTVDLTGTGIKAKCTSWKGALRPSNPKQYNTKVKEIKSIDSNDFADRLAKLNE